MLQGKKHEESSILRQRTEEGQEGTSSSVLLERTGPGLRGLANRKGKINTAVSPLETAGRTGNMQRRGDFFASHTTF